MSIKFTSLWENGMELTANRTPLFVVWLLWYRLLLTQHRDRFLAYQSICINDVEHSTTRHASFFPFNLWDRKAVIRMHIRSCRSSSFQPSSFENPFSKKSILSFDQISLRAQSSGSFFANDTWKLVFGTQQKWTKKIKWNRILSRIN